MHTVYFLPITVIVLLIVMFFSKKYFPTINLPSKNKLSTTSHNNYKFDAPIYVTKPHLPPKQEYIDAIESIWETQQVTNSGPNLRQFETAVAKRLKTPYASAFVNGHYALEAALRALNLTGEVITTPFTFPSTIHALTLNRLQPIFCDVDPDSYNIDHEKIEHLITEKTTAILAVHVFGKPCNLDALQKIANKHKLALIYDAAHCFGVEVDNLGIGQFGDLSVFSLHATKVFHCVEGGLITYKEEKYREIFSRLRNFGYSENSEDVEIVGSNMKMSEFHAAMGLLNLNSIDSLLQKRHDIFEIYVKRINKLKGFKLANVPSSVTSNYAYCAIEVEEDIAGISRDNLFIALEQYNIFSRKYFYPLCTNLPCYKNKSFYKQNLNMAAKISEKVLCLPLYPDLDYQSVHKICDAITSLSNNCGDPTHSDLHQFT